MSYSKNQAAYYTVYKDLGYSENQPSHLRFVDASAEGSPAFATAFRLAQALPVVHATVLRLDEIQRHSEPVQAIQ